MKKNEIKGKVVRREEFSYAGSLQGKVVDNVYVVYSYNTPILVRVKDKLYINKQQYSATTTKHLNLALDTVVLTTEVVLRKIIKKKVEEERNEKNS